MRNPIHQKAVCRCQAHRSDCRKYRPGCVQNRKSRKDGEWQGVPWFVQMVRALRMTPAQLSAMLSSGTVPGSMVDDNNEQEENSYEE